MLFFLRDSFVSPSRVHLSFCFVGRYKANYEKCVWHARECVLLRPCAQIGQISLLGTKFCLRSFSYIIHEYEETRYFYGISTLVKYNKMTQTYNKYSLFKHISSYYFNSKQIWKTSTTTAWIHQKQFEPQHPFIPFHA